MANPIKGPFPGSISSGASLGKGALYKTWSRYRQAKPYDLPLPYDMFQNSIISCSVAGGPTWGNAENYASRWRTPSNVSSDWYFCRGNNLGQSGDSAQPELNRVINTAREKFMGEVGERVEGMVNLLQLNQAVDMIANRMMQLHRFTKALRRGNIPAALGALRISARNGPRRSGVKGKVKDFGDAWLEYSYGIKPIVEDIYNGAKILSSDFDPRPLKASAKEPHIRHYYRTDSGLSGGDLVDAKWTGYVKAIVGGKVIITNPNLYLLQKMGLTNPLEWAWELVPFSFVFDWIVGFGDYLSSLDDTVGLSIQDGYWTWIWYSAYNMTYRYPYFGQFAQCVGTNTQSQRQLGLPTARIVKKRKVMGSLPRALNATSLLVQGLRS